MNVHAVDKPLNYFSNDYTTYYPLIPPGPLIHVFFIRIQVTLSIAGRGRSLAIHRERPMVLAKSWDVGTELVSGGCSPR